MFRVEFFENWIKPITSYFQGTILIQFFREIASAVSAEQTAVQTETIDLTFTFDEKLRIATEESMDAVLLKQENKLEAHGFIEDLINPDESAFEQLDEDDLQPPPIFQDPVMSIIDEIDEIIADFSADLDNFDFDLNQFL